MSAEARDVLADLIAEENAEIEAEIARTGRSEYRPKAYGFLATLLRRHGEISDDSIRRAQDGFAAARERARHRVFAPRDGVADDQVQGAMMVVSHPHDGLDGQRYSVMWQGADERVYRVGDLRLPGDRPASLAANEADLRRAAKEREVDAWADGFALSAYARRVDKACLSGAQEIWQETSGAVRGAGDDLGADAGVLERARKPFIKIETEFERRRHVASLRRFREYLDPEAVKVLNQTGVTGLRRYNWLVGDGDPARRDRRVQAAQAYPLFFGQMSHSARGGTTQAIDAGEPLAPALAQGAGAGGEVKAVRRLQGVHWQRAGRVASKQPGEVLKNLSEIPPNWTPEGRKDWAAFHSVMALANQHARNLGRERGDILRGVRGDWRGAADALGRLNTDHAGDMMNDIRKKVVLPVIAQKMAAAGIEGWNQGHGPAARLAEVDNKTISRAVFGDKSPTKVDQAVRRWHRALPRMNAAGMDPLAAETSWPALSDPFATRDGWTVTPLTTGRALAEEGAAMEHCVGGYIEGCVNHGAHILSVRDPQGGRVSTVDLREIEPDVDLSERAADKPRMRVGDRDLVVYQHFGIGNDQQEGRPVDRPEERAAALSAYLEHLVQAPPDYQRLDAGRAETEREMEARGGLRARVGFDPLDREVGAAVFEVNRESMIGPGRKAETPEAFLRVAGIEQSIDAQIAELSERQQLDRDQAARRAANQACVDAIAAATAVDPQAHPAPAMTFEAYYALPEARRPGKREVEFVRSGEDSYRDLVIEREGSGRPKEGAKKAAERLEALLVDRAESGVFGGAQVARIAERTVVAFTREEAEAAREVAQAVRTQRAEAKEQRQPLRDVLADRAMQRFTDRLAARRDRGGAEATA